MIELAEQFVLVKINTDKQKSVAKKFRVSGLPAIVFADGKGRSVGKIRGYRPADDFVKRMEEVVRVHRELPKLEAKFEADPTDLATGGLLASVYAFRGEASRARKCIKTVEQADPDNEQGHLTEAYMAMAEYYGDKEELAKASKFFSKAARTGKDSLVVADARFGAARAFFQDRTRFELGSRACQKRLKAAKQELTALLAMADLPEDQKQQADELLKSVKQEQDKSAQAKQDKQAQKKKRGRRR